VKSVRLLPIVIFAAVALLFFKGFGLIATGGYVFSGSTPVAAAGAHPDPEPEGGTAVPTMALPSEPTMTDASPTLDDHAPTLAGKGGETTEHGGDAEATAHGVGAEPPVDEPGAHTAEVQPDAGDDAATAHDVFCNETGDSLSTKEIGAAIAVATKGDAAPEAAADCPPVDPRADAAPVTEDANGNLVPLNSEDGTPLTEKALLERLAERRNELDSREAELSMLQALVEAAEKRIDERAVALQELEARINALVDQKKAMEEGEFKALVGMYETMKPGEAAAIFDDLDMNVLLRLARGMNPRKMAPIMAKMSATRAQELTGHMAVNEGEPTIDVQGVDPAALPQIVGQ
jgi:flagellar motility protein MotE (MotC chaperone)